MDFSSITEASTPNECGNKNIQNDNSSKLLLKNCEASSCERKEKYVLINKLLKLKQTKIGKAAEYTIEFRSLARRLGWPDKVLIDIIGSGLIDDVREEFDKVEKPSTLFEATNIIIRIDKNFYFEKLLRKESKNHQNHKINRKSFNRKKINKLNKSKKAL